MGTYGIHDKDKDKHNKAQNTKEMSNLNPTTNQSQWEHPAHTTHDKDKHNKAQKTNEMSNLNLQQTRDNGNIRHTQHTTKNNTTMQRKLKR